MKKPIDKTNIAKWLAVLLAVGVVGLFTSFQTASSDPTSNVSREGQSYTTDAEKSLTSENSCEIGDVTSEQPKSEESSEAEPPARYELTSEERAAIEQMVASEGGYCEYRFQALVALCILNGCEADNLRPLELFARGDFWLTHNVEPTDITKQAVSDVFDRGIMPTEEKVRYYYNPSYCESPAHETFPYVLTCCGCRFFKDKDK